MNYHRITSLQFTSWVVSCGILTWSSLLAFRADTSPVDPTQTENTEEISEESDGLTTPLPPNGDFQEPSSIAEMPFFDDSQEKLKDNASDQLLSEAPYENADEPENDGTVPWMISQGNYYGQPSTQYGNVFAASSRSGFTSMVPTYLMRNGINEFREGFTLGGISFSTTYDSNSNKAQGVNDSSKGTKGECIFSIGSSLSYMSTAKEWTFGGHFSGSYSEYLNEKDNSGFSPGYGLVGHYKGSKLDATLTLGGNYDKGDNRYYNSNAVEQLSLYYGLNLSYDLSPKTSLQANIGQNFTTASAGDEAGGDFNDTHSFSLGLTAYWKYSPLLSFGPGISSTYDISGSDDARTSFSPTFSVNYKVAQKISMSSTLGCAFSQYDDGGSSDPSLTGSIGLNYSISKESSMNMSISNHIQPDPTASGSFTQVNSLNIGYQRKIREASVNLTMGYEIDSSEASDKNPAADDPDSNYFNIGSSVAMPLSEKMSGSLSLQYSQQRSKESSSDWNSVQAGLNINRSF